MNLSTIALMLLAWQLLSNGRNTQHDSSPRPQIGLTDFLSDETKSMLNCVDKLSSSSCSQEDKTSAIFQMMSNPAVMNLASNLFGGKPQGDAPTKEPSASESSSIHKSTQDEHVNDEGYRFETPSASSQEFFRQIDHIADTEVKHKLYWFYDNWYVK